MSSVAALGVANEDGLNVVSPSIGACAPVSFITTVGILFSHVLFVALHS